MRVSFNWLKDYVDIRTSPAIVAQKLTIAGLEVTSLTAIDQDTILEIEVTPNRSDCLSIIGIARELAAITDKELKLPKIPAIRGESRINIPIQIQDKKLCGRYLGRVIKNLQVGPSPEWLVQRLETMGIRALNNIVDITNFCLLEFGQPLHAFNLDKLEGPRIIVRPAHAGEEIVTIDAVKRQLQPDMLVIADKFRPQAIAGIMGGKDSEVSVDTTNILLESAYFNPGNIHNTSRKLGLATQSSYRFERGVDLQAVYLCSLRATDLIRRLAQAGKKTHRAEKGRTKAMVVSKLLDKGQEKVASNKVKLRYAQAARLLGTEVSSVEMREILRRLRVTIVRKSKDSLSVDVPSFRQDISREADLIEEIARLYGYDKIPLSVAHLTPNLADQGRLMLPSEQTCHLIRQTLAALGFNEIMTYSLISRQDLKKLDLSAERAIMVKNPLSYEQEMLRPTLLVGMLNALVSNLNRNNMELKLFELSQIYLKPPALPGQTAKKKSNYACAQTTKEFTKLCLALAGKKSDNWMSKLGEFSFFDLKGAVEALLDKLGVQNFRFAECDQIGSYFMPGRCSQLFVADASSSMSNNFANNSVGYLGEVKKEVLARFDISYPVYLCELALDKFLSYICLQKRFVPLARFPSIARDISLIAPDELLSEQIVALINKIGGELVVKVTLFDQYCGEQIPSGFRGLAYSIEYRSREKTLTAEEVDVLHRQVRQALTEELGVQIR